MSQNKANIRNFSFEELKASMEVLGEKPFRSKQVYEWLWKKNAASFEEMSNLSKDLRAKLEEHYFIDHIKLDDQQISSDKTIKCAFSVEENKVVEGVLIPTTSRTTACISSQVGCSLACTFCATGRDRQQRQNHARALQGSSPTVLACHPGDQAATSTVGLGAF